MIDWLLTTVLTGALVLPVAAVVSFCRGCSALTWLLATCAIATHITAWQLISTPAAGWLLIGYEITGPIFGPVIFPKLFGLED